MEFLILGFAAGAYFAQPQNRATAKAIAAKGLSLAKNMLDKSNTEKTEDVQEKE